MRLAALYSGGKDSTYAIMLMEQQGHEVPILLSALPEDHDSMLYHTPNVSLVGYIAESMKKILLTEPAGKHEELDALRRLIHGAREAGVAGVITGAIQSDYQHSRMDRLCSQAGLKCFSPLWRKDQNMILSGIIEAGIRAVVVATAAEGLGREHLGMAVDAAFASEMERLHERYGINQCGEGGEYETYTLDSPLHTFALEIVESRTTGHGTSSRLNIGKIEKRKKF